MLEALGAELVEFSPLRDEGLPERADLVIVGCGCPDRYAEELAANLSLISALKHHVCLGRRIYAEGGGTAYLGRYLVLGHRRVSGAGILPFDAHLRPQARAPRPVTRVLTRDGWLGPSGTSVRGYRCGRWTLRPAPDPTDCPARSGTLTRQRDIYFRHHAVGSLVHLHLAALPHVVAAFVGPHRPSLAIATPQP
jgi:cobyrinic acid a,c-diamide synthase